MRSDVLRTPTGSDSTVPRTRPSCSVTHIQSAVLASERFSHVSDGNLDDIPQLHRTSRGLHLTVSCRVSGFILILLIMG